jgi:hypothetical protein
MRRSILLLTLIVIFASASITRAQAAVTFSEIPVAFIFGESITLKAGVQTSAAIDKAQIIFQPAGSPNSFIDRAEVSGDQLAFTYNVPPGALRPFASIRYRFTVESGGQTIESPEYAFAYVDNRYSWQTLEDSTIRVHWYLGDLAFGQKAFDTAHIALQSISRIIPISPQEAANIYIYASGADLQSALNIGGQSGVIGHTAPDLGVVMLTIAPGAEQNLEMEKQIPHEMGHLLLYQDAQIREKYTNLPVWLREGIATIAEINPNPDAAYALSLAAQNNTLIAMQDLCAAFPPDASGAFLAYAEARSFTQYLIDQYGNSGLQALIAQYSNGVNCEQGALNALGATLSKIENHWRAEKLGENVVANALTNLAPFILLMLIVLIAPFWQIIPARRPHGQ